MDVRVKWCSSTHWKVKSISPCRLWVVVETRLVVVHFLLMLLLDLHITRDMIDCSRNVTSRTTLTCRSLPSRSIHLSVLPAVERTSIYRRWPHIVTVTPATSRMGTYGRARGRTGDWWGAFIVAAADLFAFNLSSQISAVGKNVVGGSEQGEGQREVYDDMTSG